MQLQTLTDDELLRHAHNQLDPITGTELEAELVRRFEVLVDEEVAAQPLLDALDENGITKAEALLAVIDKAAALDERVNGIALLDLLCEFDIDDPAVLRNDLIRLAKFDQTADDLA